MNILSSFIQPSAVPNLYIEECSRFFKEPSLLYEFTITTERPKSSRKAQNIILHNSFAIFLMLKCHTTTIIKQQSPLFIENFALCCSFLHLFYILHIWNGASTTSNMVQHILNDKWTKFEIFSRLYINNGFILKLLYS